MAKNKGKQQQQKKKKVQKTLQEKKLKVVFQ